MGSPAAQNNHQHTGSASGMVGGVINISTATTTASSAIERFGARCSTDKRKKNGSGDPVSASDAICSSVHRLTFTPFGSDAGTGIARTLEYRAEYVFRLECGRQGRGIWNRVVHAHSEHAQLRLHDGTFRRLPHSAFSLRRSLATGASSMGQQFLTGNVPDTNGRSSQHNSRFTRKGLFLLVPGRARLERNYGHAQRGAHDSARRTIRYFKNGPADRTGLFQES